MKNEYEHAGSTDRFELYSVRSDDRCINGVYASDDRVTGHAPSDFVWTNRGNGPEVINDGVHGPFSSVESAKKWVNEYESDLKSDDS